MYGSVFVPTYSETARNFTHILKLKEKVFDSGPTTILWFLCDCTSVITGAGRQADRLLAK